MNLHETALRLVEEGKGIIALDESVESATKRLVSFGIESTPEKRRDFRELFITARGAEQYLSGAILHDETMRQVSRVGLPFPELLRGRGMLTGVKVDEGTEPIHEGSKEVVTKGLEHLEGKLPEYVVMGASFVKWRAVILIEGSVLPSDEDVLIDTERLAKYARISQNHGLVPMVEPEVLLLGTHTIGVAQEVIARVLTNLFDALKKESVDLKGILLKTSMALSGSGTGIVDEPTAVAEATLTALHSSVPEEVPGIVFLSGGQTPEQATRNLSAIAHHTPTPWNISFSFARALQEEALEVWGGNENRWGEAQAVFLKRLKKVAQREE